MMDPQRWARHGALFDEQIELDPAERARRLEEIAAADSEPYFDPLRSEPRYRELLTEMGIPEPS